MAPRIDQTILCFVLFIIVISTARDDNYGRRTVANDQLSRPGQGDSEDSYSQLPHKTSSLSEAENHDQYSEGSSAKSNNRGSGQLKSQSSGSFYDNREKDYDQRPNQHRPSGGSGHSNNVPNSGSSGFFTDNIRPNQHRPSGGSSHSNNGPNSGSSGFFTDNVRPNQHRPSGGSSHSNNGPNSGSSGSFTDNVRPNQHRPSGGSSHSNNGPNSGSSGSFTDNVRPNQHRPSGGSSHSNNEPNSGSSGSFTNNMRPNEQHPGSFGQSGNNQRPNQHQSPSNFNQFNNNHRPSTTNQNNEHNQRPSSQSNTGSSDDKQLCYKIFGCFSTAEPWTSKLRPIPGPLPPENNSAVIYFYSRPVVEQRYLINLYPEFSLGEAKFDNRRPTVIIIHGFIQDGNELWMNEMKNAYLRHVDANVMIVDWGKGSRRLSYLQAAGNTRLIGKMISHLIKRLMDSHRANPRDFHLIGHSLGAQIASYASKEVPGIGRLTALDPAQPGFEGFDKRVRLDKSDAEFVDVIHTSAKPFIPTFGLGMIKPHGHVDFYMNGGFDQPLCVSPPKNSIKEIKSIIDLANLPVDFFGQTFTCDHTRAHAYMTEAINNTNCIFWGHKATVKNVAQGVANTLTQGLLAKYVALSTNCSKDDCTPLGLRTKEFPLRGSFVVTTNGKFPYCRSEESQPSQENEFNHPKGSGNRKNS